MGIKAILATFYVLVSLLIIVGWPLPLLMLLVHHFLLFICKLEEIVILRKK